MALFETALDLPPDRRARFLRDECGSDSRLHARLMALLAAAEVPTDHAWRGPGVSSVPDLLPDDDLPAPGFLGDEDPFMVLEYLRGESLQSVMNQGPMAPNRAIRLMIPVMRALARDARNAAEQARDEAEKARQALAIKLAEEERKRKETEKAVAALRARLGDINGVDAEEE